jgi:hypothetical protein
MENLMYLGTMQHEIWPNTNTAYSGGGTTTTTKHYKEFSMQFAVQDAKYKRGRITPYVPT